ncbi:MAG: 2Fe-2S ferredoxin [Woeseiaceae bacterium]|jgi:2Fe-2S ferredoxin|tara:strand:- start:20688 stop:21008 length:321 start_codon:yes stop_codon:yes gene_type:complete
MPKINYVTQDGGKHEIDVDIGYTVMEGAVNNDLDGLPAECGGACACATCHAYIDPEWLSKLPAPDDMEDSMLDAAFDRRDNSRLTCQIEVTNELDGLVVHIAENEC